MWLNMIDHDFDHYWTCNIIIFAPSWGNFPSLMRQSLQMICPQNVTTKEVEKQLRQNFSGSIPESTKEKESKPSEPRKSKYRKFGKYHDRAFRGRVWRGGGQLIFQKKGRNGIRQENVSLWKRMEITHIYMERWLWSNLEVLNKKESLIPL